VSNAAAKASVINFRIAQRIAEAAGQLWGRSCRYQLAGPISMEDGELGGRPPVSVSSASRKRLRFPGRAPDGWIISGMPVGYDRAPLAKPGHCRVVDHGPSASTGRR